jgi:hypothetical protein
VENRRLIALAGFAGALVAALAIGDPGVRLANTILDDNPVVFAHFLADPHRYAGDALSTYGQVFGYGTAQNWVPALLFRHLGLDPVIPSVLFILLQHVLLAVALCQLALAMTRSRLTAVVTVAFAFAAEPWRWNLAAYASVMPWPYPGHLVMPVLLFAALAAIQERPRRVAILLAVAALIHPTMTLAMIAVISIYYVLGAARDRARLVAHARRVLWLALPVAICVLPPLLLTLGEAQPLTAAETMAILRANGHANPLAHPAFRSSMLPALVSFLVIALLALGKRPGDDDRTTRLWSAAALATVALSCVHAAAMTIGVPKVAQLIGTRTSVLLVLLLLPLVVHYALDKIRSDHAVERWAGALLIVLLAAFREGVYLGPLAACLLTDVAYGGLGPWRVTWGTVRAAALRRAAAALLVGWFAAVVAAGAYGRLGGPNVSARWLLVWLVPGVYLDAVRFPGAVVCVTLALLIARTLRTRAASPAAVLVGAVVALAGVVHAWQLGRETASPLARANYAAQRWAQTETPDTALFLVAVPDLPWRTMSERPSTWMAPNAFYVYSGSRRAKQRFADRVEELRALHPRGGESSVRAFAAEYGAHYVVAAVTEAPFALPVAYRNAQLVIYSVPGAEMSVRTVGLRTP